MNDFVSWYLKKFSAVRERFCLEAAPRKSRRMWNLVVLNSVISEFSYSRIMKVGFRTWYCAAPNFQEVIFEGLI